MTGKTNQPFLDGPVNTSLSQSTACTVARYAYAILRLSFSPKNFHEALGRNPERQKAYMIT